MSSFLKRLSVISFLITLRKLLDLKKKKFNYGCSCCKYEGKVVLKSKKIHRINIFTAEKFIFAFFVCCLHWWYYGKFVAKYKLFHWSNIFTLEMNILNLWKFCQITELLLLKEMYIVNIDLCRPTSSVIYLNMT